MSQQGERIIFKISNFASKLFFYVILLMCTHGYVDVAVAISIFVVVVVVDYDDVEVYLCSSFLFFVSLISSGVLLTEDSQITLISHPREHNTSIWQGKGRETAQSTTEHDKTYSINSYIGKLISSWFPKNILTIFVKQNIPITESILDLNQLKRHTRTQLKCQVKRRLHTCTNQL